MSNGITDFLGNVGEKIGGGFDAIKGFGEKIGSARYKKGEALSDKRQEELRDEIRLEEIEKFRAQGYSDEDAFDLANESAREKVQKLVDNELTFFGEMTTPRSLATAGGIIAAILAGRESQRRYDDYMENRPKYDPGQNPFMANGGGIQSFADGNEVKPFSKQSLRDMMIMNMKEKPMSAMIKTMTAIDSPEILMALLGMNQGGGIQGFANGTPEFPRMTGDIQGPGTGTSDSIPAMLSDGEHVLTKQEVSQIGGGNNDLGHQKLYAMREELRSKAKSNGIGRM
jgi:hypothetical protein